MRERESGHNAEDVRRSVCHLCLISPLCFNEWHQSYLCSSGRCLMACDTQHSLLSALICHPISHWVIPSLDTDPDASPVCFVTLSANQRPVFRWADQWEARVSVFSSVLGPGARIMTKLFEQFSGVMSIMLILSAGHLLGILTQCVANNNFITIS